MTEPDDTIPLSFRPTDDVEHVDDELRADLSAAAVVGETLFVSCDETASVERLVLRDGAFVDHENVNLGEFFDLPGGPDGEMDVEGLSIDDGYLWVTGSHSLKRDKPEPDVHDRDEALDELTDIDRDPNRDFLGRVPLVETAPGVFGLAERTEVDGTTRRAACMKLKRKGGALRKAVRHDDHFGPFLDVPCKENGFDVEGIAARGERVFLGLRGPVLRGWAIVLELRVKTKKKGRRLKPRRIGDDDLRYRKAFLDLGGLGVRDLLFDGDDLLVLAGPTMDLDGPVTVTRWTGALDASRHAIVPRAELETVMHVPHGDGVDHAEGLALLERDGRRELLVVYDSPARERLHAERSIDADLFALRPRGTSSLRVEAGGERDVVMSRTFDAPLECVFEAWTTPGLVARWLGARGGWTMPVCEIDLRVGGRYRYVWRHDERGEMGVAGSYVEVSAPTRIACTERFDDPWYDGEALVTTALEERDGATLCTLTVRYPSTETRDMVLASPMSEGVADGFDTLAALLAERD